MFQAFLVWKLINRANYQDLNAVDVHVNMIIVGIMFALMGYLLQVCMNHVVLQHFQRLLHAFFYKHRNILAKAQMFLSKSQIFR